VAVDDGVVVDGAVVAGVVPVVGEEFELLELPQLAAISSKPPITNALTPIWR
jgi:hypothetical protein